MPLLWEGTGAGFRSALPLSRRGHRSLHTVELGAVGNVGKGFLPNAINATFSSGPGTLSIGSTSLGSEAVGREGQIEACEEGRKW